MALLSSLIQALRNDLTLQILVSLFAVLAVSIPSSCPVLYLLSDLS